MSGSRCDKGVIVRPRTSKEKCSELKIIESLINSSKSIHEACEFLKIIIDGGIFFLKGSKLEKNLHKVGLRARSEQAFKSGLDFTGSGILEQISEDGLR
jgi:hypothetical protein